MSVLGRINRVVNLVLNRVGVEVRRLRTYPAEYDSLVWFLEYRKIPCVLDVGANEGQFASNLFAAGYTGTIISFEPMPREHRRLSVRAANHPRWRVAPPMALGESNGTSEFHVAGNSISSSLLPMESLHLEAAPHSAEVGTIQVTVARLDEVLASILPSGVFLLKIDTQGTEREVIAGSAGVMDRMIGICTELSFAPLYKGQALFSEMFETINALGFKLADLSPGFRRRRSAQELLQCDALFLRPA